MKSRDLLHYEIYLSGDSRPWVVFIHGAGGSIRTWSYQKEAFKKHFNVLLLDLRDHGLSKNVDPSHETYTFDIISTDIKKVLDKVTITKAHFVTLSFGSVLIQDFSMRYPDVVDKIVIAGGIFKGTFLIKSFVNFARVLNVVLSYPTMYSLFSYLLMPYRRNQKARRIYQLQARKITPEEYMKWVSLYQEFFRLLKQFYNHKQNKDTLVIMGDEDFMFLQSARIYINKQPMAKLRVIQKSGHICNIDTVKEFNHKALDFLCNKSTDKNDRPAYSSPPVGAN